MKLILIAESDLLNMLAFRDILEYNNYQTIATSNYEEALRLGGRCDLLIVDTNLDGCQIALSFISKPIIILTGLSPCELCEHSSPYLKYLYKPFGAEALLQAVKELIGE